MKGILKESWKKLKQIVISILPIIAVVGILDLILFLIPGAKPLESEVLINFFLGAMLVIVGQVLFLVGVDNSIMTMGEMVGSTAIKFKKIFLVLGFGFLFGFLCTIAEPDVQVLGDMLGKINPNITSMLLIVVVALGVGIYVALSLLKTIFNIKIKYIIFISYILVFVLAIFSPPSFRPLSFDSGGVTTGPITVPFILALCIGVASVKSKKSAEDSFGMVALASIGPIMAVMILGIISGQPQAVASMDYSNAGFGNVILKVLQEVSIGLLPIAVIFIIFQLVFLKLPKQKVFSILFGVLIVFIGLLLFLVGVEFGFSGASHSIGKLVGELDFSYILIPIGVIIGVSTVYTEPAIRILGNQVENITAGHIKNKVLLNSLAIGIGVAVALGVVKAMFGINILWFVVPAYAIALVLMFFCPEIFTSIAFDSGGVASGPITATFTLPFVVGIAEVHNQSPTAVLDYAFGLVALVAVMPTIVIQVMGIIYKSKEKSISKTQAEPEFDFDNLDFENFDFEKIKAVISNDIDISGLI